MRAAIDVAGNDQAVPVYGRRFWKPVGYVHHHSLAATQPQGRTQERAVVPVACRAATWREAYRPGLRTQRDLAARIGPQLLGDGQGRFEGIIGDRAAETRCGDYSTGHTGCENAAAGEISHCCLQIGADIQTCSSSVAERPSTNPLRGIGAA